MGVLEGFTVIVSKRALDDTHNFAEVDLVEKELVLHPGQGNLTEFVYTIMHEILHILYPKATEATVKRIEKSFKGLVTPSEMSQVFREAAQHVVWEETE